MSATDRHLLLGNEAIAQAALDAGIAGAYSYPGTPATEILEAIQHLVATTGAHVHDRWSANEKTALEEALGMAYAGRRALAAMKHVGLNVASDAFMSAAITGVNAGLVIVVADDPGMHSSQNEQDTRFYAHFAQLPLFEPADQQQAYDMVHAAFALSEAQAVPVLLRTTTRLAHARAAVIRHARPPPELRPLPPDRRQWVLVPMNARRNYATLLAKQPAFAAASAQSPYNVLEAGTDRRLGVIVTGLAINYVREAFGDTPCPHPLLRLGQYPVPGELVRALAAQCEALLVVEEGMPLIEEQLLGLLPPVKQIHGRLDGTLPRAGELGPDVVARAFGRPFTPAFAVPPVVVARPPRLCNGCPHISSMNFVRAALAPFVNYRVLSDIGCYALGALPPFDAVDTCVDMGASITMAKGAADAGMRPALAVIGDSTFAHSGMTGLLDCVAENTPITVLILDNDAIAMTGGQESFAAGPRLEQICLGLGVDPDHLHVLEPLPTHDAANAAVLREELQYEGVSVVIARRPCVQMQVQRHSAVRDQGNKLP